ncbi:MAG: hypothetical protein AVDCRST_MAG59-3253, partial [uncultured Thermomicrobiales bacterium]
ARRRPPLHEPPARARRRPAEAGRPGADDARHPRLRRLLLRRDRRGDRHRHHHRRRGRHRRVDGPGGGVGAAEPRLARRAREPRGDPGHRPDRRHAV